MPANETAAAGEPGIGAKLDAILRIFDIFDNIIAGITWVVDKFMAIGLTDVQVYAIIGIICLVGFLLSVRFFGLISKILIVGLILFVIVSLLGLV